MLYGSARERVSRAAAVGGRGRRRGRLARLPGAAGRAGAAGALAQGRRPGAPGRAPGDGVGHGDAAHPRRGDRRLGRLRVHRVQHRRREGDGARTTHRPRCVRSYRLLDPRT